MDNEIDMSELTAPTLVLLGRRVLCAPHGLEMQCVARTRKGARCANRVHRGPLGGRRVMAWTGGLIEVVDLRYNPADLVTRWLAQHCLTHDTLDVTDCERPEWEPFQPEGLHADLVRPLPETPTLVG